VSATESDIFAAIQAAVAPTPVYRIVAPELTDDRPVQTPYVVFERDISVDYQSQSTCGVGGYDVSYIVDCLHHEYGGARGMVAAINTALRGLSLEFEQVYEDRDATRVYRCSGSFSNWESDALATIP
jgi:hypothetical protein